MTDLVPPRDALEYARGLHGEIHASNKDLYNRAQIVLTLDGIVLAAGGAALAAKPDDLRRAVDVFAATTWVALGIAGSALIASVLSSALALFSRHRQGRDSGGAVYEPATMWFYARVAELDRHRFVEAAERADAAFETRVRLEQVATMAPIMVRRAAWVNRAFGFTALTFVAFALASTDYLVRLAS
jgi:hypothetical protein